MEYSNEWIGIDLGTYNSSAAMETADAKLEIIRSSGVKAKGVFFSREEKYKEFPSFISFDKNGCIDEIGMNGKERAYRDPGNVVWGIKRLLGKTYTELKESGELDRFPYRIRPDRKNGQCYIAVGDKAYTPIQLCAEIFKKIKHDTESQIEKITDSIVVSVPAYFDPLRVTPIIEAARLAGFVNIKSIPEPVAAALAYRMEVTVKPRNVLVFDLGAGTLDVTAGYLYRNPDQTDDFKFQVMKNTGDPKLGGIDMDDRVMELIRKRCELDFLTPEDLAHLRRTAETAKIRLSEEEQVELNFKAGGRECRCHLDQLDLRAALEGSGAERNLLEDCRRQIMAAIDGADWTTADIELLLLIGGPTRLPCIHDIFKTVFYDKPAILKQLDDFYTGSEQVDRMTAVSVGAAMSASRKVDDRVPYGHGIEDTQFGSEEISSIPVMLIPRDSSYPFQSGYYRLGWTSLSGLFEIKIIQQVPDSEISQLAYEYRFMGVVKFAVKDPRNCLVVVQMGYSANRELEINVTDIAAGNSAAFVGINQYACIGMSYPMSVKRQQGISMAAKKDPPEEALEKFTQWTAATSGFIRRKADSFPVHHMLIYQIIGEITDLVEKNNPGRYYEAIYTKLNSLIWNSNSRGLLHREEYNELISRLSDFEGELFRV